MAQPSLYKAHKGRTRVGLLAAAFCIPLALGLLAYALARVYPFGPMQALLVDLGQQYFPFLAWFRAALLDGSLGPWSWSLGMGQSVAPLFAYYLASPLNLLLLAVPHAWLREAVLLLALLKTSLAGLTCAFCLTRLQNIDTQAIKATKDTQHINNTKATPNTLTTLALSILYACCGFAIGYQSNLIWLDAFALLPLVFLWTLRLARGERAILYPIWLALAILCNYYLGFMVCIFVLLIFVLACLRDRLSLRQTLAGMLRLAAGSLIGASLTAAVTLPAFLSLWHQGALGVQEWPELILHNPIALLGNFALLAKPTFLSGLPNVFTGVGGVVLAALYFATPGVLDVSGVESVSGASSTEDTKITSDIQNIANTSNAANVLNTRSVKDIKDVRNIQSRQNIQNTENRQNTSSPLSTEDMQDSSRTLGTKNISDDLNTEDISSTRGIEDTRSTSSIEGTLDPSYMSNTKNISDDSGTQDTSSTSNTKNISDSLNTQDTSNARGAENTRSMLSTGATQGSPYIQDTKNISDNSSTQDAPNTLDVSNTPNDSDTSTTKNTRNISTTQRTQTITRREKNLAAILLAILLTSCVLGPLDFLWNALHIARDFPARFSFMISFVLILLGARALMAWRGNETPAQTGKRPSGKKASANASALRTPLIAMAAAGLLISVCALLGGQGPIPALATAAATGLYCLLFWAISSRRAQAWLLLALVVAEAALGIFTGVRTAQQGEYGVERAMYPSQEREIRRFLADIQADPGDAFRIQTSRDPLTLNNAALIGFRSVASFTSTQNLRLADFLRDIGLSASAQSLRYNLEDTSPLSASMLSVGHYIPLDGLLGDRTAFWRLRAADGLQTLYQNIAPLSVGFMVSPDILAFVGDAENPFASQNALFTLATGVEAPLFTPVDGIEAMVAETMPVWASAAPDTYDLNAAYEPAPIRWEITLPRDDRYFAYLAMEAAENTARYGMGLIENDWNIRWPYIQSVGPFAAGDTLFFEATPKAGKAGEATLLLYAIDVDVFWQGYERLQASQLRDVRADARGLTGTIDAPEAGLLYTSVPYEPGWTAYVDGAEVDVQPLVGALVCVPVGAGAQEVRLAYSTPGGAAGLVVSGVGGLAFGVWGVWQKRCVTNQSCTKD